MIGEHNQQARTLALQSANFSIDRFALLFYYRDNTGKEVIQSL
jgi:hypothetical protein